MNIFCYVISFDHLQSEEKNKGSNHQVGTSLQKLVNKIFLFDQAFPCQPIISTELKILKNTNQLFFIEGGKRDKRIFSSCIT